MPDNLRAPVNKIIPFSSVDGPGNRTAIFLQGCNINCKYCHNPETRALCIHCGDCVDTCPTGALKWNKAGKEGLSEVSFNPDLCVACDTCIKTCRHDASPRIIYMTPGEVMDRVRKQIPFIRGISVSGGECMLYPEFLEEVFKLAKKESLSTLVDTNGTISFKGHESLLAFCDGVMLDIKAYDSKDHKYITDFDNENVLLNAEFLAKIGKLYEVRVVVVPDLYDAKKSIENIGRLLTPFLKVNEIHIKIIAYRPFGVREQFKNLSVPGGDYLKDLSDTILEYGFKKVTII